MNELTPHFTEEELNVHEQPQSTVGVARVFCYELLEPIRDNYGRPLIITSGFRGIWKNKKCGGEPTSYHLFEDGRCAADFDVPGICIEEVFDWIRLRSGLKFDKVILEYKNSIPDVIHIQLDINAPPRRLAFIGHTNGLLTCRDYKPVEVV